MKLDKRTVRLGVSTCVILTYFFSFFSIMFFISDYATSVERLDTALLLIPITAAYVLAIGRRAISGQLDFDASPVVNVEYLIFVVLITVGFLSALTLIILSFPNKTIPTIDALKRALLIIEIGLGGAFGLIVEDLFGRVEKIVVPSGDSRNGTTA